MENFVCSNCRYKFKADKQPKTCPYCNKANVEKEKSADELLSEIGLE
jgi:rubrerythrin